MNITAERLKKAMELRNIRQTELAEKTGIGKSSISTYLTGAYSPKQNNIYKMAKVLRVSEAWLAGLNVPMEPDAFSDEALKFALFNTSEGVTDKMLEEVKAFARFIKQKNI